LVSERHTPNTIVNAIKSNSNLNNHPFVLFHCLSIAFYRDFPPNISTNFKETRSYIAIVSRITLLRASDIHILISKLEKFSALPK
jgi:hypothetical protein